MSNNEGYVLLCLIICVTVGITSYFKRKYPSPPSPPAPPLVGPQPPTDDPMYCAEAWRDYYKAWAAYGQKGEKKEEGEI